MNRGASFASYTYNSPAAAFQHPEAHAGADAPARKSGEFAASRGLFRSTPRLDTAIRYDTNTVYRITYRSPANAEGHDKSVDEGCSEGCRSLSAGGVLRV